MTPEKASKASKASKVICYTGVGAKRSGKHSEAEFLKVMKQSSGCKVKCPEASDAKGWIEWSGAESTSAKRCDRMAKKNALIGRLGKNDRGAQDPATRAR